MRGLRGGGVEVLVRRQSGEDDGGIDIAGSRMQVESSRGSEWPRPMVSFLSSSLVAINLISRDFRGCGAEGGRGGGVWSVNANY
jgi:hypothetical protein